MAVSYIWPGSLPQRPTPQYSEIVGLNIAVTPMDAGPAKMRRRSSRPDKLSVVYEMTDAQLATLRTFVLTTLKGTARFGLPHPRTVTQIEARIVPTGEGDLYTISYVGPNFWLVSLQVEILP